GGGGCGGGGVAGVGGGGEGVAGGGAAAGADDVEVAAHLGLEQSGRDVEVAGRNQDRGAVGATAARVVRIAGAGREERRDHRIGTGILLVVRARRVLVVLPNLGEQIEKGAVDEQMLLRGRQALERDPRLIARLAEG